MPGLAWGTPLTWGRGSRATSTRQGVAPLAVQLQSQLWLDAQSQIPHKTHKRVERRPSHLESRKVLSHLSLTLYISSMLQLCPVRLMRAMRCAPEPRSA